MKSQPTAEWEEGFNEMWNKDFIQYSNGGASIVLDPSKYKRFVHSLLESQKQELVKQHAIELAGRESNHAQELTDYKGTLISKVEKERIELTHGIDMVTKVYFNQALDRVIELIKGEKE